ncbi:MAG: hypothetical protein N2110_07575, partial [Flavobacteriales bacterium]|nr:hypothetical protein [Flavobacteriales bacterium]
DAGVKMQGGNAYSKGLDCRTHLVSAWFFVNRTKDNLSYTIDKKACPDKGKGEYVRADLSNRLQGTQAREHFPQALRLVICFEFQGRQEYLFVTHPFSWTASTVAQVYKERRHIKVFFKLIKYNRRI